MPGPAYSLRRATPEDAEAIAAVNVAAARAGWTAFLDREDLDRFEPPTDRMRARIEEAGPRSPVLVAVETDQILGFALLRAPADEAASEAVGELSALYVDPSAGGRGVGRGLMAAALAELRAAGCREAVLWTEERNHRPKRIYERYGWRADGAARERVFLGRPIREVRFRLDLAAPRRDGGPDGARAV